MNLDITWFSKEIKTIIVRNLNLDDKLQKQLPSTHVEISTVANGGRQTLLSGPIVLESCNPMWKTSGLWTASCLTHWNNQDIYVQFLDETNAVVSEQTLDVSRLVFLGNIALASIGRLPLNSIFFGSENGYFVSNSLYTTMLANGLIPAVNRSNDKDRENERSEHAALQEAVMAAVERTSALRSEVQQRSSALDKSTKSSCLASKTAQILKLREEVQRAQRQLLDEMAAEQAEQAHLCALDDLKLAMQTCTVLKQSIDDLSQKYKSDREDLLKAQFLLEARQIKLLSELQSIYPIEVLSSGERSIRGIELPADVSQRDDDLTSSALGYVVHLLLLTSKYLEVPLRYQFLFYASRSLIRDPVTTASLPLYRKGNERERFERAVIWLKRNIEQLLLTRGVPYDAGRDMLFNIEQLFIAEMCPTMIM